MPKPGAGPSGRRRRLVDRWSAAIRSHLGTGEDRDEHPLRNQFLQGMAYRLGSGAVSLLILWWQTHH